MQYLEIMITQYINKCMWLNKVLYRTHEPFLLVKNKELGGEFYVIRV